MIYLVEGLQYSLSYSDLRDRYNEFINLTDEEFLERVPEALHLACIICYLKETPLEYCLSDMGVIHELTHLIHIKDETLVDLPRIRITFEEILHLS
jgi:hypothetical protein